MKKVQVSTVKQTADVEVIFINANLISKVIKSHIILDSIISEAKNNHAIQTVEVPILDENGCVKVDEKETTLKYYPYKLCEYQLKDLNETVLPFLNELVEAFDA